MSTSPFGHEDGTPVERSQMGAIMNVSRASLEQHVRATILGMGISSSVGSSKAQHQLHPYIDISAWRASVSHGSPASSTEVVSAQVSPQTAQAQVAPESVAESQPSSVEEASALGVGRPGRKSSFSEPSSNDSSPVSQARQKDTAGSQGHVVEDKKAMAERMIASVQDLICAIWPNACQFDRPGSAQSAAQQAASGLVPLRAFIREILRRSKSSCGTLKCAEWYLTRLRDAWYPEGNVSAAIPLPADSPLLCPRRAFLSSLILSHKFLHDRVYSNKAWAKISGLDVKEITKGESALALALDYRLWFGRPEGLEQTAVEEELPAFVKNTMQVDAQPKQLTVMSVLGPRKPSMLTKTNSTFSAVSPEVTIYRRAKSSSASSLSGSMPGLTLDSKSSNSDEWDEQSTASVDSEGDLSVQAAVEAITVHNVISRKRAGDASLPSQDDITQLADLGSLTVSKKRKVIVNGVARAIGPHL